MIAAVRTAAEMETVPLGPRRAALLVSDLTEADRSWLLAALDSEERRKLEPLLDELASLGLQTVRAGTPPGEAFGAEASVPRAPTRIGHDLATLPLRAIGARLEDEPDDVVRLVLARAPDASVRQRALRAIAPARRSSLAACPVAADRPASEGAAGRALEAAWSALPPNPRAGTFRHSLEALLEALRKGWRTHAPELPQLRGAVPQMPRPLRGLAVADRWRAARRPRSSRWSRP